MEKKNSPSWDRNLFSAGSVVFLAVLATFAAQAVVTNTWKTTCMAPNTPATAYLWNDPSNWDTEQVPAAYDEVVFEKPSCVYYVKLPDDPVIVSKFTNKTGDGHYMALVGGRIIYSSDSSVRAQFADGGGWVFSDIESASATDSSMPYISGVNLAGRAVATYQNFVPSSGWVSHRLDKFAYSSNPLRTDDLVVSSSHYHNPGSGNVAVYAPQGADALTADWALSEGSPYATRVASSAHALAAGTIVSCPGVLPAGTFVKRIFSNSLIELSEPAETGATGTHALSFAAFTPEIRINVAGFSRIGTTATEFQLYKYREQDVLRYEMTNYYGYAGQTSYFGISATQVSTGFPGTHVFHNFNDTGSKVILRNAHFELAGKTDGTATTFATNVHVSVPAGATGRITVTNNIAGVINTFTNLQGTLVKDGAGTLTVKFVGNAVSNGAVVVEGGVLVVEKRPSAGEGPLWLKRLKVGSSGILQVPECDIEVDYLEYDDGATLRGPGRILARHAPMDETGLVFEDGSMLVRRFGEPGGVTDARPEGEVVGHPVFWVDASKPESIDYYEENGTNFLSRWNDCRAGEPMFCTNVVRHPVFVNGEDMTNKYVHLRNVPTYWLTNTESLVWSVPVHGVKAVFLVQDPRDGGGEILGHTSRLADSLYYGTQGGPYYRGGSDNYTRSIIASSYATGSVKFGRFYLNGSEVCGYSTGYLGKFSQVIEHHVNTNEYSNSSQKRYELAIDAFGMGYRDGNNGGGNHHNGYMRIHEYIIYTNSLTHTERLKVAQYLSRKWLGKDINWTVAETNAEASAKSYTTSGQTFDIAAGDAYALMSLGGSGDITKTGDGTLFLGNVTNARVTVKGGELVVRSLAPTNTFVPDGAWVHVDASDPASAEISESGGVKYLSKWHNLSVEGGWYGPNDSHSAAFYKENAMNGLPVIDTGDLRWSGNSTPTKRALRYVKPDGTKYTKLTSSPWVNSPVIKTMFFAADAAKGGNSLMGGDYNGFPAVGLPHTPSTDFSTPIINAEGHNWGYTDLSNEFNNATSIFRTNGVPVNANAVPFSGGQDVFSVRLASGRRGDVLGDYGYDTAVNGIAYGEVLLYRGQLLPEEFDAVEAYFRKKWKGVDTPGITEARMDSLVLENGAAVRICGYGLSVANPAGTLTLAALGGGGSVAGKVKLAAGASIVAVVDGDGAIGGIEVEGSLDLTGGGSVVFTGEVAKLAPGLYPVLSATELSFGGAWECRSPISTRTVTMRRTENTIYLNVCACGTLLIMR